MTSVVVLGKNREMDAMLEMVRKDLLGADAVRRKAAVLRFGMLVEKQFRQEAFDDTPERNLDPDDLSVPVTVGSRNALREFGCAILNGPNIGSDVAPPIAATLSAIGTPDCWMAICSYLLGAWNALCEADRTYVLAGILPPYFSSRLPEFDRPDVQAQLARLTAAIPFWTADARTAELRDLVQRCAALINENYRGAIR